MNYTDNGSLKNYGSIFDEIWENFIKDSVISWISRLNENIKKIIDENDVKQECFISFYNFIKNNNDVIDFSHIKNVIFKIAKQKIIYFIRLNLRKKRDSSKILSIEIIMVKSQPFIIGNQLDQIFSKEIYALAMEQLKEEEKRILQGRLEGDSWSEIALENNCSRDASRMTYNRAIQKLRSTLGENNSS